VTLGDSQKSTGTQSGATVSTAGASSASQGCGANTPAFDLVVFFSPLPAAGPTGVASVTALPVSSTTPAITSGGSK
jgi:hypothetical protein